jgi:TetR/AcrR family transcriptional repressor of nem operon
MGRTSDARRRVLDAACELIGRRGYTALGVAEICATAGVPKGSFYYFFDSKQSLTLSVIDEHWTTQRGEWERALRSDRPPLVRLRDLFEATAATQQRAQDATGSVNGCVFANLALELSNQDEPARNRLQQVFEEQIDLVHEVIADAIDQGFVPSSHGGRVTARSVVAQLEGLVLFAKLSNDPGVLADLWQQTLRLLGAPELTAREIRA